MKHDPEPDSDDAVAHAGAGACFALFDTAIGHCAIAWASEGICGVWLPEAEEGILRRRMRRRHPGGREEQPPVGIQVAVDAIRAHLAGELRDLLEIELDWRGVSDFHRSVYEITRHIAPGRVRSYGDIAAELGDKGLARAVGQALGLNPFAPVVPCHRVLAAGGRWGGFSAPGGIAAKLQMLAIEGARPDSETAPLF